jgi:hypothetical protein
MGRAGEMNSSGYVFVCRESSAEAHSADRYSRALHRAFASFSATPSARYSLSLSLFSLSLAVCAPCVLTIIIISAVYARRRRIISPADVAAIKATAAQRQINSPACRWNQQSHCVSFNAVNWDAGMAIWRGGRGWAWTHFNSCGNQHPRSPGLTTKEFALELWNWTFFL